MEATQLWAQWQDLVLACAPGCTTPGRRHFLEWITGLALNVEEHTITQSLVGLGRPQDWKGAEYFAEYGYWDQGYLERATARLLETAPGRVWHGYHIWAGDDTEVHRTSAHVWGTCTFHEYAARCPNRAETVRAHNWVVVGAVLANPHGPAWFLPHSGRLYFRRSQLPFRQGHAGRREPFRTKCELLVELVRGPAETLGGKHLAVFDGAFAVASVVRPLVKPAAPKPRVDFVTRLRPDARLYARPPAARARGQRGPKRKWGRRLPPPRRGGQWSGPWQEGRAFLYGRWRQVHWKEVVCLWKVLGHDVPVKAVVAEVAGYRKRFTVVTSATELTGLQVVEIFCARFRQEDGFRDLKQRLGWEEGRAWTKAPILRTTQALVVTMLLLRLLQFRLQQRHGDQWWLHPPWNPRKTRPSVLDVERLLWQHRGEIQQLLAAQLGQGTNSDDRATHGVAM